MVEGIAVTKLCVDGGRFMLFCWLNKIPRWCGNEQIHLASLLTLLVDLKDNVQRMAKRNGGRASQKLRVFALVPVSRKLIRNANDKRTAVKRECFRRLQPRS